MVEERKLRDIHDINFGGRVAVRNEKETRESGAIEETSTRSVNADMEQPKVPDNQLARVMAEIITRILALRAKFGTPAFGFRLENPIFVDLCLQFRWRGSPGWWGVVASAIQNAHRVTPCASVRTSAAVEEMTCPVGIMGSTGKAINHYLRGAGCQGCRAIERETPSGWRSL